MILFFSVILRLFPCILPLPPQDIQHIPGHQLCTMIAVVAVLPLKLQAVRQKESRNAANVIPHTAEMDPQGRIVLLAPHKTPDLACKEFFTQRIVIISHNDQNACAGQCSIDAGFVMIHRHIVQIAERKKAEAFFAEQQPVVQLVCEIAAGAVLKAAVVPCDEYVAAAFGLFQAFSGFFQQGLQLIDPLMKLNSDIARHQFLQRHVRGRAGDVRIRQGEAAQSGQEQVTALVGQGFAPHFLHIADSVTAEQTQPQIVGLARLFPGVCGSGKKARFGFGIEAGFHMTEGAGCMAIGGVRRAGLRDLGAVSADRTIPDPAQTHRQQAGNRLTPGGFAVHHNKHLLYGIAEVHRVSAVWEYIK